MANNGDWREMQAGRELDRVVAEAMGHVVNIERMLTNPHFGTATKLIIEYYLNGERGASEQLAHYSTDLNAAISLINGGTSFVLSQIDGEGWQCSIIQQLGIGYSKAETPALAVCRAFLSWKETTNGK